MILPDDLIKENNCTKELISVYNKKIHDYLDSIPEIGKVLSVASGVKLAREINNGEDLNDLELALLRSVLPEDIKETLLYSYINKDDSVVRISTRVNESASNLNRNMLLNKINNDLQNKHNRHYGFINICSALTADHILYNSNYHNESFHKEGLKFLKNFPDNNELETMNVIQNKSEVLYLGMDLSKFDPYENIKKDDPLILWNHRWEYDKNPEPFFRNLFKLKEEGLNFKVALLGESFNSNPDVFEEAKVKLKDQIVHYGYCDEFSDYAKWVWMADILPVTSNQDFFGGKTF